MGQLAKGEEMANLKAGILGTGHSYPEGILTNAELEHMVETSDEWITTRTGIKQRRKAAPDEYTSLFAVRAAQEAIERARIDPSEIDLLICATVTPDQILPATACLIQAELGAHNAAAFDLVAACSGFLYGLTLADTMIRTGQSCYALVIGAEVLTKYVDYTDRSTCVIFGDGAGAALLGPVEGERGIISTRIRSDGRFAEHLHAPGGGTRRGSTAETIAAGEHFYKMKGNELFKVAVRSMADISREVLEDAGKSTADIDLFIPHQANQRITDAVGRQLNVDESRIYSNISMHGNTSSASIPIALDECVEMGRVKEGDLVLMASFGGGVTWGGVLLRW
ncbi:MAG: 3-oxoacyl-[acyl-carrier-protein] synthase [Blastocatellia bacterium]|jgi:3-oxoacyl-[acyl-carrier-protein] synthase-3|nr:3-oxoacyl-[acyl-carrier-protein] synthase [Blastocatellia bacterium]